MQESRYASQQVFLSTPCVRPFVFLGGRIVANLSQARSIRCPRLSTLSSLRRPNIGTNIEIVITVERLFGIIAAICSGHCIGFASEWTIPSDYEGKILLRFSTRCNYRLALPDLSLARLENTRKSRHILYTFRDSMDSCRITEKKG